MSSGLWIIVLEAGLALALLLFLVWWTLPKKSRPTKESPRGPDDPSRTR